MPSFHYTPPQTLSMFSSFKKNLDRGLYELFFFLPTHFKTIYIVIVIVQYNTIMDCVWAFCFIMGLTGAYMMYHICEADVSSRYFYIYESLLIFFIFYVKMASFLINYVFVFFCFLIVASQSSTSLKTSGVTILMAMFIAN